jgi:squalene-associated FAD-dependent desaturase
MSRPEVIVIGAGFAGLSAAVRLVQAGARVLVIEERRRLGGRATAFADPQTGEVVDNGQHALFGCYRETFAFLRAIDTYQHVSLDERLDIEIVDRHAVRSRLVTPMWPPPLHLVGGLLRWSALGLRDRAAALRMGLVLRRLSRRDDDAIWTGLGSQTAEAWLIECGQTPRLRELLWEPLVVAALNQSPATAAAAPFARVLARMFNGTRSDAAIGLPRVPLDELYAEPARRWLESHGALVRAGSAATLVVDQGRAVGVDLRDERIKADAVVSSVPWFSFPALVNGIPALAPLAANAALMAASPIVTVNLWYDRTVTDTAFVGLPGRTFQWVFDKGRIFGGRTSHLSLVSSGADASVAMTNDQLIALAHQEVAASLPLVKGATIVRGTAVREKRATFSLAPGQPPRPRAETPMRGFYLAGDWTDTGLPATIEGAVESGHRAAALIVSSTPGTTDRAPGTTHAAPHPAPRTLHPARSDS